ncbi:alpha-amylase [Lactobacillus plantarum JDM1] [Lactiplantibacillus mudanjiangensis]|uniref:glycoside hydrolase family 13 protein n=1 Tax=Lactiplantibacillus mudanjiangensis TaxID=1296538 RepID=UPI001014CC12|nr:glycoside hydrolase family 13 protein [Lactiplantibacillus mudanjiangensis]VDG31943.1 alpha-amylase [Lactobacillus plantarum JDM1] [Lactiplantibacillus mudanjiangensis]
MQIDYNSFQTADRSPFGAVMPQTPVQFRLTVTASEPISQVNFRVAHDGQWDAEIVQPMHAMAGGAYTTSFIPTQAGLYFYYFEVQLAHEVVYYGCRDGGYGGTGVQYARREQVQMYQLTTLAAKESLPQWYREGVAYQIFIDRFYNGNSDGHVNAPKANSFLYGRLSDRPLYIRDAQQAILRWDFYGGNLRGVTAKVPYLKQLGVTSIYLTPIFQADSNHRYDTGDYYQIDPVLGDLSDFDQLVTTLHQAGMRLILDGVFNHVGVESRYFNRSGHYESLGAAQARTSPYYSWFTFINYPTEYDSWWGINDLPTVDKQNQSYRDFIYAKPGSVIDYWTARGVDGWRLDVADELPDDFIAGIRQALDRYPDKVLIGEVWEDASHKLAYGQRRHYLEGGRLQAVMNYPLRRLIIHVLTGTLAPSDWWRELMTLKENYPATAFNYNFNNIGSHDTPRILTMLQNDQARLSLAMGLLLTLPGVPCLYYGDEAKMTGGKDPDNRAFYPWNQVDQPLQQVVQQWVQWRRAHPMLNTWTFAPFYMADYGIGYVYWEIDQLKVLVTLNVTDMVRVVTANDLQLACLPTTIAAQVRSQLVGHSLKVNQLQLSENFT